jgi:hypothetical protein
MFEPEDLALKRLASAELLIRIRQSLDKFE